MCMQAVTCLIPQHSICGKILDSQRWFKLGKLHLCNRKEKRRSKGLGKWHGYYFFIFECSLLSTHKNNAIPVARISPLALIFISEKELIPVSDELVKSIGFRAGYLNFFSSLSRKMQYSCMSSSYSLKKTLYIMWLEISFEICCILGDADPS